MKKLLITGGTGFLASRLKELLAEKGEFEILTPGHNELEITSMDNCKRWFEENRPDAVVHLAAIPDIAVCERNEELSRKVNTLGPVNLATCARDYDLSGRFIYASSDQVYTANLTSDRLNIETDHLAPDNLYGLEKLEAEEQVSAILPGAIALRMDWMFDLKPGKMNYLKLLIMSVKEQRPTEHAVNELRAETYVYETVSNIRKFLLSDAPGGAYNFGSPAYGTSYDTAVAVYELLGKYMDKPVDGLAVPIKNDVDRSLAMDQTKLNSVGLSFGNTVESAALCLEREASYIDSIQAGATSEIY